jgi:hypothetical protein
MRFNQLPIGATFKVQTPGAANRPGETFIKYCRKVSKSQAEVIECHGWGNFRQIGWVNPVAPMSYVEPGVPTGKSTL